jgi:hypothetical protein
MALTCSHYPIFLAKYVLNLTHRLPSSREGQQGISVRTRSAREHAGEHSDGHCKVVTFRTRRSGDATTRTSKLDDDDYPAYSSNRPSPKPQAMDCRLGTLSFRTRRGGATTHTARCGQFSGESSNSLLAAKRGQAEEGPHAAERLNTASGGEIGTEDLVPLTDHPQPRNSSVPDGSDVLRGRCDPRNYS